MILTLDAARAGSVVSAIADRLVGSRRLGAAGAIVGLVLLAGCESGPEVVTFLDACELATKAAIENSSTYQRADHQEDDTAIVQLQYDHENTFGAMVRGYARCQFEEGLEGRPQLVAFSVNGNGDPVLLEIGQEAIDLTD